MIVANGRCGVLDCLYLVAPTCSHTLGELDHVGLEVHAELLRLMSWDSYIPKHGALDHQCNQYDGAG